MTKNNWVLSEPLTARLEDSLGERKEKMVEGY
jgi:hypothetical protein